MFIVGKVNPKRIQTFKRTAAYDVSACELLVKIMAGFTCLFTIAHVMAEVSNLTDLEGPERAEARRVLAQTMAVVH